MIIAYIFVIMAALMAPAVASEYTLDIFGNANMDDAINEQDIAYVNDVIHGTRAASNLTDANNDGKTDENDIVQIKEIINGTEKELVLIDASKRVVKIKMPVKRVVSSSMADILNTLCALDATDKIVGIPDYMAEDKMEEYTTVYMSHPELAKLPVVGSPYYGSPNLEVISYLSPDLIMLTYADADAVQKTTGVPTISYPSSDEDALSFRGFKWLKTMGYIFGREERAGEICSYLEGKLDDIRSRTSGSSDSEKPNVYLAFWGKLTSTPAFYAPVDAAGGRLVADEGATGPYSSHMWTVSKEQVIKWNPDLIFIHSIAASSKTSHIAPEDLLSDPDLKVVKAVQNGSVYNTKGFQFGWDPAIGVVESFYMAKLLHPQKLVDLDVEKEGNEILKEIYGVDGIWTRITKDFNLYSWSQRVK